MKTWLLSLVAVSLLCGSVSAQSTANGGQRSADGSNLFVMPTAPRHAEVTVKQVLDGGILAEGSVAFYDVEPGAAILNQQVTVGGIKMHYLDSKRRYIPGAIFIRNATGAVDGEDWEGMIEPDGTYTYTTVLGAPRTVRAFKLSKAQSPVAAYYSKLQGR